MSLTDCRILLGQSLQYHAYVSTATSTHQLFVINTELAIFQFQLVSCVPQWVIVQSCKRRVNCKEFLKATHGYHLQVQNTYMRGQGFGLVENRNLRKFPKRDPWCSSCLVELGGGGYYTFLAAFFLCGWASVAPSFPSSSASTSPSLSSPSWEDACNKLAISLPTQSQNRLLQTICFVN